MFTPLGLFDKVECPDGTSCSLRNCIFGHTSTRPSTEGPGVSIPDENHMDGGSNGVDDGGRPAKKRRVSPCAEGLQKNVLIPQLEPERVNGSQFRDPQGKSRDVAGADILQKYKINANPPTKRTNRAISPPPLRHGQSDAATSNTVEIIPTFPYPGPVKAVFEDRGPARSSTRPMSGNDVSTSTTSRVYKKVQSSEPLNPRSLANPPATHAVRLRLCQLLQEQYLRLNRLVETSNHPLKIALTLSSQEIITKSLDEEEHAAKTRPIVYTNVLKSRISALKKMLVEEYLRTRQQELLAEEAQARGDAKGTEGAPEPVRTGLSESEEKSFLKYLVATRPSLQQHDYITTAPSQSEIAHACEGVQACHNHEVCDRCKTRFQIFPGRREEDGALTSGGSCVHHPGRARRRGPYSPLIYECCSEEVGKSAGCTTAQSHVYKASHPARLSVVLPFVTTPKKRKVEKKGDRAIALDCEMGYTTMGFELIRFTAVNYPTGDVLIDALVRPQGEIIDLNSTYSGIYPSDFTTAVELDDHIIPIMRAYEKALGKIRRMSLGSKSGSSKTDHKGPKEPLPLCTSIEQARTLLFEHISSTTPVIGHALENDMNALRIIHPTIIDTAILYPTESGPPYRHSLRNLMRHELKKEIQTSATGHDSCEDARSAMALVRRQMALQWKRMQDAGWVLEDDRFRDPEKDSDRESDSDESEKA